MSERLTDEYIAASLRAMEPPRLLSYLEEDLRGALLELQQHRARIATHAAAHPERLSEDQLDGIETSLARHYRETVGLDMTRKDGRSVIAEIRARRAADLTEPQIDQVRAMLRDAVADRPIVCGPERIEILSDIIRAHGARP